MVRPRVVIAKRFPEDLVAEHLAGCEVVQGPDDIEWPRDRLMAEIADAEALVSWGFNRIDADLLSHGPQLKIVAFLAIGTDNFDRPAMAAAGSGAPTCRACSPRRRRDRGRVAAMLSPPHGRGGAVLARGQWQGPIPGRFDGEQVEGKQLGLIGCGDIGRRVARRRWGSG